MKKRLTALTALFITAALVLSGCGRSVVVQKETTRQPSTGESWTVMIYMCGSALEEEHSRAGEVLRSLAYDLPENINVIVETGGSKTWSVEDVDPDYTQDYEVQKDGIRLVNQNPSLDMGSSSTYSSFLRWSIDHYSADHYISVIWDHGGGPVNGVAFDSAHDFDSLSVSELTTALSSLDTKIDMIGFDASLTSTIEMASAVSLYADYMVASEDVIPTNGWDYYVLL